MIAISNFKYPISNIKCKSILLVDDILTTGSTLKEAASWGKVDTTYEQMAFSEATISLPLLASYVYHKGSWKNRKRREFTKLFS